MITRLNTAVTLAQFGATWRFTIMIWRDMGGFDVTNNSASVGSTSTLLQEAELFEGEV